MAPKQKIKTSEKEMKFRQDNADEILMKSEDIKRPCTICKTGLFAADVREHPVLGVAICNKCYKFYTSGEFTVDEDGDQMFCTWCGQGGSLFLCSDCKEGAFCKTCIKRNVDLEKVEKDKNWLCFLCNVKPLWKLRAYCKATVHRHERRQRESQAPNMLQLSQLKSALGKRPSTDTSDDEEVELPATLKRRHSSFIAKDDEDPHADPASGEISEEEEVEDNNLWKWAKKKKRTAVTKRQGNSNSSSEQVDIPSSGNESDGSRRVPKLKIKLKKKSDQGRRTKSKTRESNSESEPEKKSSKSRRTKSKTMEPNSESEYEKKSSKSKKNKQYKSENESEHKRQAKASKKRQKHTSESDSEQDEEVSKSQKKTSQRAKPSLKSKKKYTDVNEEDKTESESEQSVTVVHKKIKGKTEAEIKFSKNNSESEEERRNHKKSTPKSSEKNDKENDAPQAGSSKQLDYKAFKCISPKKKLSEAKPVAKFNLESSSDDEFQSSSGEEEVNLDWLTSSLEDFTHFVTKNQEALHKLQERVSTLNNESSPEAVRDTTKKFRKYYTKCIDALNTCKENVSNDYIGWYTKATKAKHSSKEPQKEDNNETEDLPKKLKKESRLKKSQKEEEEESEPEHQDEAAGVNNEQDDSTNMEAAEEVATEKNKQQSEAFDSEHQSEGDEVVKDKKVEDIQDQSITMDVDAEEVEEEERPTEEKQVVEESSEEEHYFDTNTLHLETPHTQETLGLDKSLAVLKSVADEIAEKLSEKADDSTRDPFAESSDEENASQEGGMTKHSPPKDRKKGERSLSNTKKVSEDRQKSHREASESPKKEIDSKKSSSPRKSFVGKKPGPASKTLKLDPVAESKNHRPGPASKTKKKMASPCRPEEEISIHKSKKKSDSEEDSFESSRNSFPKAFKPSASALESQATHFSEEEDIDQHQEELAKMELLNELSDEETAPEVESTSEDEEDSSLEDKKELIVKTVLKKNISSKTEPEEPFTPSNWEEFSETDRQKFRSSFVPVESLPDNKVTKRRKKQRDSDAELENLCDLDALENPSTSDKPRAKSKKRSPKKVKLEKGSGDDKHSSEIDSPGHTSEESEAEQKPKKSDTFKPIDEEEEAKKMLLMSSDSEPDVKIEGSDSDTKKDKKKSTEKTRKKKSTIDSDESDHEKSQWKNDKILKGRVVISSSDDEKSKPKKKKVKKAVIESDESGGDKSSDDVVELDSSDDFLPKKKLPNKRKRKPSSSEATVGSESSNSENSSDEDLFETKKKLKKRKRIVARNSSSASESDEGRAKPKKESSPLKGKKRKIMRQSELELATQDAAKEEKERLLRYNELQKMYNKINEERGQDANVSELVLEFDPKTKEPLVEVHKVIATKLKPHQVKGIKFMWDAMFESLERANSSEGSGCILAHCMGLGKTLQIVALIHTVTMHPKMTKIKSVLVVTPLTTVENWKNEFAFWTKDINEGEDINVFDLSNTKKPAERKYSLKAWSNNGGVMIMSYDLFRNLANPANKGKNSESFQECLVDPGPDIIICDEGHVLKNEDKKLSIVMSRIRTRRRIILSGTPLQNNLIEYHCMMQFVKPNFLGNRKEFTNRFVNPIKDGQHKDSTAFQVRVMKRRACVLHKMLEPSVQRFDYSVLKPHLQEKYEYVIKVRLSELQVKLYSEYLKNCGQRQDVKKGSCLFSDYQNLLRVWNHPYGLLLRARQDEDKENETDSAGSLKDFICDNSTSASGSESDGSGGSSDGGGKKRTTRQAVANGEVLEETTGTGFINTWWRKLVTNDELDMLNAGNKMVLLFSLLKECDKIGDKLLVFSQSLYTLSLIEHFLALVSEATDEEREEHFFGIPGDWCNGINYFRIDGQTNVTSRAAWIKKFNNPKNFKAKLFLVSTRAGGLGVNMVGANRVVIFDASWNPSNDMQSIFRVYRFGQEKPCYIYRFLGAGTMEEKIYDRQVTKLALSGRVVDKHTIDRHYSQADLEELYSFEPYRQHEKTMAFPKDRLLAELYQVHKDRMEEYFEHDSLLEDRPEEKLTEEEQQAAWYEFENEKEIQAEQRKNAQIMHQQRIQAEQALLNLRMNPTQFQDQMNLNDQLLNALLQQNPAQFRLNSAQQQLQNQAMNPLQSYAPMLAMMAQQQQQQQPTPAYQAQVEMAKRDHGLFNSLANNASNMMSSMKRLMMPSSSSNPQTVDDEITVIPSTSKTVSAPAANPGPAASTSSAPLLKVRSDLYK